jgi:undecaprenyl diphosphate synthase|tara:strand:- start:107 stop:298 length:192 start_codon:yes stop_codon:yes gene_type:complete
MYLFINTLKFELNKILKGNVKIIFIGDLKELSNICRREIFKASKLSKSNNKFNLVIAINYSGR